MVRHYILTGIAVFFLLSVHYLNAAWTEPSAEAPNNNVPAPINVGSDTQSKAGILNVDGLGVSGTTTISGDVTLSSVRPSLTFDETDYRPWWLNANAANFYFQVDRDGDDSYTGERYPLVLRTDQAGTDHTGDFARFANAVRAEEYCDYNGGNCFTAADNSYKCKTDTEYRSISVPYGNSSSGISCGYGDFSCMANYCHNLGSGWYAQNAASCLSSGGSWMCVFGCQRQNTVNICGYY